MLPHIAKAIFTIRQNRTAAIFTTVFGCGATGIAVQQYVSNHHVQLTPEQRASFYDRESPEQRRKREHQIRSIEHMLNQLKDKSWKEKIAAANVAPSRQWSPTPPLFARTMVMGYLSVHLLCVCICISSLEILISKCTPRFFQATFMTWRVHFVTAFDIQKCCWPISRTNLQS